MTHEEDIKRLKWVERRRRNDRLAIVICVAVVFFLAGWMANDFYWLFREMRHEPVSLGGREYLLLPMPGRDK